MPTGRRLLRILRIPGFYLGAPMSNNHPNGKSALVSRPRDTHTAVAIKHIKLPTGIPGIFKGRSPLNDVHPKSWTQLKGCIFL